MAQPVAVRRIASEVSWKLTTALLRGKRFRSLPPNWRLILWDICDRAPHPKPGHGQELTVFRSHSKIAEATGLHADTVQRNMPRIIEAGYLKIVEKGNPRTKRATVYMLSPAHFYWEAKYESAEEPTE